MSKRRMGSSIAMCALVVVVVAGCSGAGAAPLPAVAASADTSALETVISAPEDLAFDANGDLFVSEFLGHVVDRIDATGSLTVVAGTGTLGFSGDGGAATEAELNMPTGLLFTPDGSLVIADHRNDCIRQVGTSGIISTIAGTCTKHGTKGDGGPATKARLNDPIGIALDGEGDLYIADEQNALVRVVDTNGTIDTFAGGGRIPLVGAPDGTPATSVKFSHTSYVVADGHGGLYVSDFLDNEVVRIDSAGRITRVAGTGDAGFSGDGGAARKATLNFPTGLALDGRGRLYISDAFNNRVRMVDLHGVISTIAGSGPTGPDSGSYGGDGASATAAHLNAPAGLAFDGLGNLLIADQGNNCVRMLHPDGTITLVAGIPQP